MPWTSLNWKSFSEDEYNLQLEALQLKERQEGFDVKQAPLFKLVWIAKSPTEFHLIWTHHHMLLDGWCLPIVMQQLLGNYQAIKEGKSIPRLSIPPYKTYIAWLARQDKKTACYWWQRDIQHLEHSTVLGIEKTIQDKSKEHSEYLFILDQSFTSRLKQLVKALSISLNSLIQGSFALMLHRYSQKKLWFMVVLFQEDKQIFLELSNK